MNIDEYKQQFDKLKKEQRPLVDAYNRSRTTETKKKIMNDIIIIEKKLKQLNDDYYNSKSN